MIFIKKIPRFYFFFTYKYWELFGYLLTREKEKIKMGEKNKPNVADSSNNAHLLEQIKIAKEKGEVSDKLYNEILLADKKDLSWEMFYELIEIKSEQQSGYWASAYVATHLLEPAIAMQFYKNQNARVKENVNEDFTSEVLMEIQRVIPNYDPTKSQFPYFINLYVKQVGYTHNKDTSVYMQKTKGIRIFSTNSITKETDDNGKNNDGYSNMASNYSIEEEIEKKEAARRNAIFNQVVVKKAFSSKESQQNHRIVEVISNKKIERNLQKMSVDKDDEIISRLDDEISILESSDAPEKDMDETIINATIWYKFLGGIGSYDDIFLNKIQAELKKQEDVETYEYEYEERA